MDARTAALRAFAPLFAAHAATLAVAVAWLWAQGIGVSVESWKAFGTVIMLASGLAAAGYALRNEWGMLGGLAAAAFLCMPPGLATFSYAATAAGGVFPLQDALFARIDAAMGFDWLAAVALTNQFPLAIDVLRAAYEYTMAAVIYVYVLLVVMKRADRILEFSWALLVTCLIANILSALLPAIGAYIHHAPPQELRAMIAPDAGVWHLQHFEALRNGTFRSFVAQQTEGLVTFPSYHTACALLVPLAMRGLGLLTGVAWGFAALVVISTVPIGGHYLIDVIAGVVLALGVWAALARVRWSECPAGTAPDPVRA